MLDIQVDKIGIVSNFKEPILWWLIHRINKSKYYNAFFLSEIKKNIFMLISFPQQQNADVSMRIWNHWFINNIINLTGLLTFLLKVVLKGSHFLQLFILKTFSVWCRLFLYFINTSWKNLTSEKEIFKHTLF